MESRPEKLSQQANSNLPVLAVIFGILLWSIVYGGAYLLGWPGEIHYCAERPYCFCEAAYYGEIAAQKSNTWSDLGFVFAAIFIAFHGRSQYLKKSAAGHTVKSYNENIYIISLYASVVLFMGPGSMFFHGGMTKWGGAMDVVSMYLFVFFIILYLFYRSWDLSVRQFFGMYVASVVFTLILSFFFHKFSSEFFRLIAVVLVLIALVQKIPKEKLSLGRSLQADMENKYLFYAFGFFAFAIAIWTQSDSGGPLCDPDSLLQGHAAWHLLSACMTVAIHFYFLSEKTDNS